MPSCNTTLRGLRFHATQETSDDLVWTVAIAKMRFVGMLLWASLCVVALVASSLMASSARRWSATALAVYGATIAVSALAIVHMYKYRQSCAEVVACVRAGQPCDDP